MSQINGALRIQCPEDTGSARALPAAEDARPPGEAWTRFLELIRTAVGLFNAGALGHATILLELAERWSSEQAFDPDRVAAVVERYGRSLDPGRLLRCAQRPKAGRDFGTVLRFFPALSPTRLLEQLRTEPRRERRRWLISLLIANGAHARAAARAALPEPDAGAATELEWYFRRNLLHLLRRIAPTNATPLPGEVDLVLRYARLGLPSVVVKEAVALLGQTSDERAEFALMRLLAGVSDMLPIRDAYEDTQNLAALAGRIAGALAGFPTERAHRCVIDHAERRRLETGGPMTALAALGRHDLSGDERAVDRLVGIARRIPRRRVAGILIRSLREQDDSDLVQIVEALASTPLPVVRRALERVARRYPEQESGRTAARVLAGFAQRTRF